MIDIMKCAESFQEYCRGRKECEGCIFFRYDDRCAFRFKLPEECERKLKHEAQREHK